jgi:hypothetical protein
MEQDNQTYLKGFNEGYKLAKFSPDLFEKIKDSLSQESEYDKGILGGAAQWQQEKEQQRLKELNELDRGQGQELERD